MGFAPGPRMRRSSLAQRRRQSGGALGAREDENQQKVMKDDASWAARLKPLLDMGYREVWLGRKGLR